MISPFFSGVKTKAQRNVSCCTVEVEFPEISEYQLGSFTDFLAELLAEERSRELEQSEEEERP